MEPQDFADPIFIIDLNELEEDGSHISVAMDYTLNAGPRVTSSLLRRPTLGEWVRVHSDEDDTLYYARVDRRINDRDYIVAIDWASCEPVLNDSWSARIGPLDVSIEIYSQATKVTA